jgi:hypothetical protein
VRLYVVYISAFVCRNERPPERDRAQRASEESQCMELHDTNREGERLALAEKVTQF